MEPQNIEKAGKVAEDFIKQQEEAKKKEAESKMTDEQKKAKEAEDLAKVEADKKAKLQQEQKEKDDLEILEKEESQLTEEQKKRKEEIVKSQEGEPDLQKILKGLKDANKRIDKLTGRNKEQEFEFKKAMEEKEKEIQALKNLVAKSKEPSKDEVETAVETQIEEASQVYLKEDADKPRELKREMAKEELEEWFAEDPVEAQRWMIKQEKRRDYERNQIAKNLQNKVASDEFLSKQRESVQRLISKYPNSKPDARANELKSQGLKPQDIIAKLEGEFPEYRIVQEIVNSDPNVLSKIDFGDYVMAELEKRLANKETEKKKEVKKVYTEEEVKQMVQEELEAERKRLASVDEGVKSMGGKHDDQKLTLTPEELALKAEVEKANRRGSKLDFVKVLERHRLRAQNPDLRSGAVGQEK